MPEGSFEGLEMVITTEVDKSLVAIDKLIAKLAELKTSMNMSGVFTKVTDSTKKLQGAMEQAKAPLDKVSASMEKSGVKALTMGANFAVAYVTIRRVINLSREWIDASNAYVENLNLFRAAMGKYADAELDFADKVQSVIGINKDMWVRQQGIFMALLTGFGNTMEASAMMSRNLTQLGYDISSFFNLPIEQAMLKVQSAVAGELEPVRRIGYDLSQARMKMTAEQMLAADALGKLDMSDLQLTATAAAKGINVTVSTLTQQEKSILRYILLMDQLKMVQGDMARTLESPANQLRILGENIRQLQIQLGNVLIPLLLRVVPIITATTMALRDMAAQVAAFFGFTMPEFDYSSVLEMQEASENMAGGFEDSVDAAKKLKNVTAGFDELNVIGDQTALQGATANQMFTDLLGGLNLEGYDFLQGLEENKLLALADKIKPALQTLFGIITGFVASRAMLDLVLGFKTLGEGLKLFWNGQEAIKGVQAGVVGLKSIFASWGTTLAGVFTPVVAGVVLAILALAALFKTAYDRSEPLRDSVKNLGDAIKNTLTSAIERMQPFLDNVISAFKFLWENVVIPLWNEIADALTPAFKGLIDMLTFLWKNVLDPVIDVFYFLMTDVLIPIAKLLIDAFAPAFKTAFDMIVTLIQNFKLVLEGIVDFITGVFTGDWELAWKGVTGIFNGLWEGLRTTVSGVFTFIGDMVNGIISAWEDMIELVTKPFATASPDIVVRAGSEAPIGVHASGGIIEDGLFTMNRGEIAGKFNNGTSVVANNQMIVEGISAGVYEAVVAAMGSSGGSGDQSINVYLSGKQINAEIEKVQRERGRKILGNQLA